MRRIATAIAALALLAGAAHAQGNSQGNRGGGNGRESGGSMQADRGNDGGKPDDRGRGNANGPAMGDSMRGGGNAAERAPDSRGRGSERAAAVDRGQGNDRAADDRGRGNERAVVVAAPARGADRGRGEGPDLRFVSLGSRGLIGGCPPGLAAKANGCRPPGQVRNAARVFAFERPDWWGFARLADGRYAYGNGYLYRLGGDGGIAGYVPLLGGALAVGNAWPSFYQPVALPPYYVDYYGLGPYDSYRYADNVIYRVDPETAAITSIAALLTGDQFAIGQPLPLGYDVYNVPYGYRDRYLDGPGAYYRYADGYVYQVDPTTQLITAAIQLLAS